MPFVRAGEAWEGEEFTLHTCGHIRTGLLRRTLAVVACTLALVVCTPAVVARTNSACWQIHAGLDRVEAVEQAAHVFPRDWKKIDRKKEDMM
jgi:hypothetical protein